MAFPGGSDSKESMWETWVQTLGWKDLLEEGMATHSSILVWRIPMDRRAWQATNHGVTKSWTHWATTHSTLSLFRKVDWVSGLRNEDPKVLSSCPVVKVWVLLLPLRTAPTLWIASLLSEAISSLLGQSALYVLLSCSALFFLSTDVLIIQADWVCWLLSDLSSNDQNSPLIKAGHIFP